MLDEPKTNSDVYNYRDAQVLSIKELPSILLDGLQLRLLDKF